jgi:hypothetical protein
MATQTFTVSNPGPLALKFTIAGGSGGTSYFVPAGMLNDIPIDEGVPKVVQLVAASEVPQGGGPGNPRLPV